MDKNLNWLIEKKIERTVEALRRNNFDAWYVKDRQELNAKLDELMAEGETCSCGGSVTLSELGVIEYLRSGKFDFMDRDDPELTKEARGKLFRQVFFADTYLMSSNAITEDGKLYNVDGNGNRVAAMVFGPKKVIVIAGYNKIVRDIDAAIERARDVAGPANCERLNLATPCRKDGVCHNCRGARICCFKLITDAQKEKGRIKVIIIGEQAGY